MGADGQLFLQADEKDAGELSSFHVVPEWFERSNEGKVGATLARITRRTSIYCSHDQKQVDSSRSAILISSHAPTDGIPLAQGHTLMR